MSESNGLPPEQESVRRLLADARHVGPPPPEVVARLDDTHAALVSERVSEQAADPTVEGGDAREHRSPGRVVDLGSRRRRMAGIGLMAAACVVVAGVAIGQALPRGGDAGESSAGSASDSSLAEAPRSLDDAGGASAGDDGDGSDAGSESDVPAPDPKSPSLQPGLARPTLFSDDDDLDVQLLDLRPDDSRRTRLRSLAALRGCDGVAPGPAAALVAAEIDGQVGVVVFRRPVEDAQVVELFVCGLASPARTITLPAP